MFRDEQCGFCSFICLSSSAAALRKIVVENYECMLLFLYLFLHILFKLGNYKLNLLTVVTSYTTHTACERSSH